MKVKFWGTRGSIPTPEPEFMKYGGNTSCIEIRTSAGELIILDAGTGIRRLGLSLLEDPEFRERGHIFISHYHWDHIQGFPFFTPAFLKSNKFHIYGQFKVDGRLFDVLNGQMANLYFPIRMDGMRSQISFHELIEQEVKIGDTIIRTGHLNHPQGNLGFRIEDPDGVVAYVTDTEHPEEGLDEKVLEIAANADLFIYDAMFTPEEYPNHRGWGHSTWETGIQLAKAAGAKRLALFHHDPKKDDLTIDQIVSLAQTQFPNTFACERDQEIFIHSTTDVSSNATPPTLSSILRTKHRIQSVDKTVTVRPSSFIEHFISESFLNDVCSQISHDTQEVILDFSTLQEIDSLALGTLAQILEKCESAGATLSIVHASDLIRDVLEITRFSQVIQIVDAPGQAV